MYELYISLPPDHTLGRCCSRGVPAARGIPPQGRHPTERCQHSQLLDKRKALHSEAESVSAYVNDALRLKASRDRRLRGIDDVIAACEAEHGEITDEQMEGAYRRAKARAVVISV
jgi:hypothetical protein